MMLLEFEIIRTRYPQSSGLTGEFVQKIRADGRVGPAVGDEALLWDLLQEAHAEIARLSSKCADLQRQLEARGRKK